MMKVKVNLSSEVPFDKVHAVQSLRIQSLMIVSLGERMCSHRVRLRVGDLVLSDV